MLYLLVWINFVADWMCYLRKHELKETALLVAESRENWEYIPGLDKGRDIGDMRRMEPTVALLRVFQSSLRMKSRAEAQDTLRHLQIGRDKKGSAQAVGTGWLRDGNGNGKDHFRYWAIH
jgi:hypothetical protein